MNTLLKPLVAKFGGTSVSTPQALTTIVAVVRRHLPEYPVLIVSALSGVTDALLTLGKISDTPINLQLLAIRDRHASLVNEYFIEPTVQVEIMKYVDVQLDKVHVLMGKGSLEPADRDVLMSTGEILSSYIVAKALETQGLQSTQMIATRLITTNDHFTQVEFLPDETVQNVERELVPLLQKGIVPVVTGFIGATRDGRLTTLGRGGSDYSAAIIAYALDAREIQIWKDVDGIYTTDHRVVKDVRLITDITYREAAELAFFGAKVLHPRTIRPAVSKKIPVRVLNTYKPESPGTLIQSHLEPAPAGFKTISFKRKSVLVNIYSASMLFAPGFLRQIFDVFAQRNISIDLVAVSEVSVSVTLDTVSDLDEAIIELGKFCIVSVEEGFGSVSLIGEKIVSSQHVLKDITRLFYEHKIDIKMISMGTSDINITLIIHSVDVERAVELAHALLLT